jgi:preprotein translocase subunit SecA
MDYLQEGINLRAMGQKDPLTEWQREGYEMFTQMMHAVAQDFVKYVMHVQVQVNQNQTPLQPGAEPRVPAPTRAADEPQVSNLTYTAPEDPSSAGSAGLAASAAAQATATAAPPRAEQPEVNVPTVKSDWEKTPRNAPCPCGSGKKFKLCHGR